MTLKSFNNKKVKTVQTMVFPVVLHGCKSWVIRKANKRKLWMWRRVLRIPRTVIRTNASLIYQIKPMHSLKTLTTICKPKYFWHLIYMSDSMKKDLMLGMTDGNRSTVHKMVRKNTRNPENNWHNILAATQNRAQYKYLIYKATENRKHQQVSGIVWPSTSN